MSVKALYQYSAEPRDQQANFNGMQLVYVYWPNHRIFCSPFAFLASPDMSMGDFCEQVVRPAIAAHPQATGLDFGQAQWQLNSQSFSPDPALSLAQNGVAHKALLTLSVPGLDGIAGGAI
ncbi:MAG TPA: phenol hydroxylase [Pseudomonas sp.]|nr:phenol hydroxylase [Pseudomonas sp.]|tara:strand:+ start:741 stop:1100 length:360 start_codon:yes stop_codon:yes gene_type:complete